MSAERFMGFGGFDKDSNFGRDWDHHRSEFASGGFLTNPFMKNQCSSKSDDDAYELCKKLQKMGISCDLSIWSQPEDPFRVSSGSRTTTLQGFNQNHTEARRCFLQNNNFNGERRFLGFKDSLNPNGFDEMLALKNERDLLFDHINIPINRFSPCFRDNGSLMFEGNMVSKTLAAMEGFGASYQENHMIIPKRSSGLPLPSSLISMINIYGSVTLMAKDQVGCRVLQKFVDEGTLLNAEAIFHEVIDDIVELSIDPFGNYIVQKLFDACGEEQRTFIVMVLTSQPNEFIKTCLNTYGTRVIQKMIKTVKTEQQIALLKYSLKPGFLALVKDLNGSHVIESCLQSLGSNDNKFVLEAATKHCAEIAIHRYGCCVLQCCISHSVGLQHQILIAEIIRHSLHFSQDPFGNYVVQYLIENQVSPEKLLAQFRLKYAELATQKFSSHVIEKILKQYPESRAEIVLELLCVSNFEYLLQDPYGNYVIQTALSVTKGTTNHKKLVEKVAKFRKLRSSPYCKKIFSKNNLKK